ncbi:hypothetical protein [Mesorhizobium sp.]|nr:hypothetical protein [Mesorhizobium sp.]TIP70331.1 MAG: hypothetical protein E5X55_27825 [Mesorhizobium sp.]TIQ06728.1 MAG: hypothetical protein E5X57_24045 [Mesorhizobium sp.]TJV94680.1 MAG: hypothetical protein E5X52_27810 [Mesorhizobium sp.]
MVIERGKLIPATPYDAERLDTYRNGVRVNVRFTEDRDRVMVRKWWAILGRAVKECKTPWQNKEQASEAIKLALGIVNLSKTVGGDFMAYPKSLTELDDPELTEAVERMIDVIYHVTGVDVSVWRKHVENIRDDEPSEVVAPSSDAGSEEVPSPGQVAADQSAPVGGPVEAGEHEVADVQSTPPASEPAAEADRDWLKLVAKMLWAATGVGEQDVLKNQLAAIRTAYTPETISDQARAKANSINAKCKLVCFGEASAADTLPLIAGIAGCEVKDIT